MIHHDRQARVSVRKAPVGFSSEAVLRRPPGQHQGCAQCAASQPSPVVDIPPRTFSVSHLASKPEERVGGPLEEARGTPQDDWSQLLPAKGALLPPYSCPASLSQERGAGPEPGPHFSVPPQGRSEQAYSTVKTAAPAVTVTNLKPATRYVFQIRAASLGPSWETQSFSPSIEVQTPGEGE